MNAILPFTPSLYGRDGRRKYLTPDERDRFIATATHWPRLEVGTLCLLLAYSGCRISEALALTQGSFDRVGAFVAIRSLKKRRVFVIREVPLPVSLIERLIKVHGIEADTGDAPMWSLSRGRAWQLVKLVMRAAAINLGPHATPKGLRHAFGVHAIRTGVPLHLVQRWLGHASLATTAIYTQAVGPEERDIAERMWR